MQKEEIDIEETQAITNAKTIAKANRRNLVALGDLIAETNPQLVLDKINYKFYEYDPDEQLYRLLSDEELENTIYMFYREMEIEMEWSPARSQALLNSMMHNPYIRKVQMNNSENLLFLNGVLEFKGINFNFRPYNLNSDFFTYKLKINFPGLEKKIECPVFDEFLESCFTLDSGEPDRSIINQILQIGGYFLYPDIRMEKFFILIGGGANGKSVFLEILSLFFNPENISSLSMEELSSNNFNREILINSKINISTEGKSASLNTEEIKKIVSGEPIIINPKYRAPFSIKPKTKLIVATNQKPYFNDNSYGLTRRLQMIEFKNRFATKGEIAELKDRKIDPKVARFFPKKDKNILLQMLNQEKEGILLKFLGGLQTLIKRDWEFEQTINNKEIMEIIKSENDTLGTFLMDNYKAVEWRGKGYTAEEILEAYREWYRNNICDRPVNLSSRTISNKVRELFFIENTMRRIERNQKFVTARIFPLVKKTDEDILAEETQKEIDKQIEEKKDNPNAEINLKDIADKYGFY